MREEVLSFVFSFFRSLSLSLKVFSLVQEVAEICFLRLNLILIAVEARKYEGGEIFLNPK